MNIYQKIFTALNKEKVKYLVVGGVAVNLYGYSRFTGDIDILLLLDFDNLKKLDGLLDKLGYIPRLPVNIYELGDKKKLAGFIKEKGLKAYTYIANNNPQLDIDIIVDESRSFSKFYDRKSLIKVWDIKLPTVALNDLIKMKRKAGRDKDLLDLKALLDLKTL